VVAKFGQKGQIILSDKLLRETTFERRPSMVILIHCKNKVAVLFTTVAPYGRVGDNTISYNVEEIAYAYYIN